MTVEEFLEQARSGLDRVTPEQADELHRAGAALLIDIRPQANRTAEGERPGRSSRQAARASGSLLPHLADRDARQLRALVCRHDIAEFDHASR